MRRTREQRIADMEAEAAALKRKLRIETTPGLKEALVIAKAIKTWDRDNGSGDNPTLLAAASYLESLADEPK